MSGTKLGLDFFLFLHVLGMSEAYEKKEFVSAQMYCRDKRSQEGNGANHGLHLPHRHCLV